LKFWNSNFLESVGIKFETNHCIQGNSRPKTAYKRIQSEIQQLIRKIKSGLGDKRKNVTMYKAFNQLVYAINQLNFELIEIAISLLRNKRLLSDKEFIRLRFSFNSKSLGSNPWYMDHAQWLIVIITVIRINTESWKDALSQNSSYCIQSPANFQQQTICYQQQ